MSVSSPVRSVLFAHRSMNEPSNPPLVVSDAIDRAARRELLAHAVAQSVGSGPALVLAAMIVAVLAAWNGRLPQAIAMMCAVLVLWYLRWRIGARLGAEPTAARLTALTWAFQLNMACTGAVWVCALVFILPFVQPVQMVLMLLIVVGAMMVALPVCSMVDGAVEIYALPQAVATGVVGYAHGYIDAPMAIATGAVFTFVLLRTARAYRRLGRDAIMPAPSGPADVVWYDLGLWEGLGGSPGGGQNAIFSGHVDYADRVPYANVSYRGQGVFSQLHLLSQGDVIEVLYRGQTLRYKVEWRRQLNSGEATDWASIWSSKTGNDAITLYTCGGAFNPQTLEYQDRVVVRAERL